MPFADYANFADCVRQNPQADDPDAYCGSIKARTENKAVRQHGKDIYGKRPGEAGHTHPHKSGPTAVKKAVAAASHLNQAVRLALKAVVTKHKDSQGSTAHHKKAERPGFKHGERDVPHAHGEPYHETHAHDPWAHLPGRTPAKKAIRKAHDPVKEEGDKKLKEADGVAADGAQDDQAFAVAFGPDNYDQLMKRIMAAPYREAYQAAGTIIKAIERKQMNMNFPGDLETHLKKAHAAVHGREMWDERYSEICDLLKKARKLLHDIEKEAEAADQEQQGQEIKQVVGKADPTDSPAKKPVTPQVEPGAGLGTTPLGLPKPQPKVPPMPRQRGGKALKAVRMASKAAAGR